MMQAGKYLGKRLLESGQNIVEDVSRGKSFRHAARDQIRQSGREIKADIIRKLQGGGGGVKRKKIPALSSNEAKETESNRQIFRSLTTEKMERCYCTKSELELFGSEKIQLAIDNSSFVEIHPIASISDSNTIEFQITGLGDGYFDLSYVLLNIQAKNSKSRWNSFVEADKCGPINYLLNTMFSECHISLNDRQISSESNYAYKNIYSEQVVSLNHRKKELFTGGNALRILSASQILSTVDEGFRKIFNSIETFTKNGSGWILSSIDFADLHIGNFAENRGGCKTARLP
ncbi:uncharacterized protein TNCV_4680351, partial [Trichonephila clavipes]